MATKNKKYPRISDLVAREGVECGDCIWEASASVGVYGRENPRLSPQEQSRFIEILIAEDENHRDSGYGNEVK